MKLLVPVALVVLATSSGCAQSAARASATTPLARLAEAPLDPARTLELAAQAEGTGDYLRADQYYVRAEALGVPTDRVLPRRLAVMVASERLLDAVALCQARLGEKPDDRATRHVLAALYIALDRPVAAERELRILIATAPSDAQPYLALGHLYREAFADAARARAMFEKYLELAPTDAAAAALRFEIATEEAVQ